jgi:hypothetical protein
MKRSTVIFFLASIFLSVFYLSTPAPVSAAGTIQNFQGLAAVAIGILRQLVFLIVGLAVVYFLWGVAKFVLAVNEEKARDEGKKQMIWGIIGIFVMVSVWGLVNVIAGTFPLNNSGPSSFPGF